MTKQKAITECMKQWEYYAETGTSNKSDYTSAKYLSGMCFFCEYCGYEPCDSKCPGWKYWAVGGHCIDYAQKSLFCCWENAETKKDRKLWASRIVWMVWLIEQENNRT